MKKLLSFVFVVLFLFGLGACDSNRGYLGEDDPNATTQVTTSAASTTATTISSAASTLPATNADVDSIISVLNANSYVLTEHDANAIQYFTDNTLVANYGISVTVTDLVMGDVGGSDWVQVVGFATEADAITYADHLETLDGGELYYREGTAVLLTYSQTALDLF